MKSEEVVMMFRHYRHDLLNDLQIIHGYASMGNMEKIKEKLDDILYKTGEERKLTNLQCPHFTLWLMNFNSTYENFRIQYEVKMEQGDFSPFDLSLEATCKEIMQLLHNHTVKDRLYNGEIIIHGENDRPKISCTIKGPINNQKQLTDKLKNKIFVHDLIVTEEKCQVTLSLDSLTYQRGIK